MLRLAGAHLNDCMTPHTQETPMTDVKLTQLARKAG